MKVKRILAAVVAFAMMLSMTVVSFAAPADFPEYEFEVLGSMDIVATDGWKGPEKAMTLDGAMVFKAVDDDPLASPYAKWIADYVIEFDQNVTATLAGNYGTYGWIASREIDFEAGVAYGIMKESGLGEQKGDNGEAINTYENVVLMVDEFTCGLDFADDTPADAKVTLGLYLTNPEDETETYLVGKEFVFTTNGLVPNYKAEEIEVEGLDFAMVFEADDEDPLASPFADWIADYEITFSNDATAVLAGQYDNPVGDNTGEWISLPEYAFEADVPVKLLETAELGKFTYADIALAVSKFQCGVDVIDAAYGTEITLNLTLTNADGDKVVVSENTFTYTVLETSEDINDMTEEQIKADAENVIDTIAGLDQDAKNDISVETIKALVSDEVDEDATEAAGYSAVAAVEVAVDAVDDDVEADLQGADVFEVKVTENGTDVDAVDVPVLVVVPYDNTKTLSKIVHVHNGVPVEIPANRYYVDAANGLIYIQMSEFSQVGIFYAGEATLKLEKVAADTFDIVLEGDDVETVKNFVSGEFKIAADGAEINVKNVEGKTIVKKFADGMVVVNVPTFVDGETWSSLITDAKITLGTIVITSRSEGEITLSDAVMHKHDGSSSNLEAEITTVIGNAAAFDTTSDGADAESHKLTVKVNFKNKIEYTEAAYNKMTITINGNAFALGADTAEMGATDCSYSVTVDVEEMGAFDIVVAGAGYRTAYYYNTMATEDRIVTFWNNVENNAQVMDVDANLTVYNMSNINFLAGDIYNDGKIDTTDLAAVVGQFGQDATAEHDLNRDKRIDSKDVAYVLVSWGK